MAKDKDQQARVELIIDGKLATASMRDLEAAARKVKGEMSGMLPGTPEFERAAQNLQRINGQLGDVRVQAGLTVAQLTLVTGSLDDLQNQAYEAGKALSSMHPDDPELNNAIIKYQTLNATLNEQRQKLFANQTAVTGQKTAYNGLGVSINQLSREMPAFANSTQTGFMAISNNLPMLVDEINKLKTANVELAAQGLPTKSIMQQVAASIFSWGTAISVGITLLTVYGKEIITFVGELIKGKTKLDDLTASTKAMNDALTNSAVKNAISGINELRINIDLAQKGILNKDAVLKVYNDTLGKTFGTTTDLNKAENNLIQNGPAYIEMTFKKAAAQAAIEEATKKALESEKESLKSAREATTVVDRLLNGFVVGNEKRAARLVEIGEKNKVENIARANTESNQLLGIARKFQTEAAIIAAQNKFSMFEQPAADKTGKTEKEKAEKVQKKADREQENKELLKEQQDFFNAELNAIITNQTTKSNTIIKEEKALKQLLHDLENNKFLLAESTRDNEINEVKAYYAERLRLAKQFGLDEKLVTDQEAAALNVVTRKWDAKEIGDKKKAKQAELQASRQLFNELTGLANLMGATGIAATGLGKTIALANIAFDTAQAISALTKNSELNPANAVTMGAAGGLQFAGGIVRIMANIGQAYQVLSGAPSFFEGGYTKNGGNLDSNGGFMARLHKDEYVVNAKTLADPLTSSVIDAIDKGTLKQMMNSTTVNNNTTVANNPKLEMLLEQLLNNGVKAEMLFNDERLYKLNREQKKQDILDKTLSA